MIERIKQLLDTKKMSATQFSERIGIQRSSLSHVLSGRNNPSLDFMLKIKSSFPEVNLNWLLLGEESMFEKTDAKALAKDQSESEELKQNQQKVVMTPGNDDRDQNDKEAGKGTHDKKQGSELRGNLHGEKVIKRVILIYHDDTFSSHHPE